MIIGTIFSIMPAFVYWLAGTLAANGSPDAPTAGTIVAFTTLQSRLFFPLGQLLGIQVEIQGSLALFDRIFEYLEMDPEIVDAPDAVAMDGSTMRGKVRFNDVSFHYPTAAVPSHLAHAAVNDRDEETADPEQLVEAVEAGAPISVVAAAAGDGAAAGGEGLARRPEPRRARARDRPVVRARAHRFRGGTRGVGGPGRCLRLGQDDHHLPRLAAVRRRFGRGRDRRHRCPPDQARLAGRGDRDRDPGDVPLPRVGPRQPPLRAPRRDRRGARGRRHGRRDPRPDPGTPRRLRHDRRRARLQAVGRREAAPGDRPGPAQGPADPDPRRGDLGARHRLGAAHPGRLRAPDGGPHDDRHRPPTVHDPARRPDPRLRARPDRRARDACRADRPGRRLRAALSRAVRRGGPGPRGGRAGRAAGPGPRRPRRPRRTHLPHPGRRHREADRCPRSRPPS